MAMVTKTISTSVVTIIYTRCSDSKNESWWQIPTLSTFFISVSSGAFSFSDSYSVYHCQDGADAGARSAFSATTRLMKDLGHGALQVTTSLTTIRSDNNDNWPDTIMRTVEVVVQIL